MKGNYYSTVRIIYVRIGIQFRVYGLGIMDKIMETNILLQGLSKAI